MKNYLQGFVIMSIFSFLLGSVHAAGKKRFIFRQDDIEDWYHSSTQVDLLNFFMDRGIGLSAGIIGNYFSGADTNLYNTLKRCVSLGADKCALFNHGSDAKYIFGKAKSTAAAKKPIKKCDDKIKKLFNNYQAKVFVPHENSWNSYTLTAVKDLGYDAISASIEDYSGMAWDLSKTPLQMPQQTTTGIYTDSGDWAANPASSIVAECNAAADRDEVCVIMIHPHEFASGAYTLSMLQTVVDSLVAAGFESTNFQTVINEVKGITPAPTMAPTTKPTLAPNTVITPTPTLKPSFPPRKRFIFRQDDIEDWYHSSTQVDLLNFFMDQGIGLSAGIIGNYFSGEDTPLYNTLQRCVSLGTDKCALFNHGSDAKYIFGKAKSTSAALKPIKKCDDKIKKLFNNYQAKVFVPHENSWNAYTLTALNDLGYDAISASIEDYSGMAWDLSKTPLQMPQQTTTGIYTDSGDWAANPASSIVAECNAAADRDEVCVIMIHPHEFASGAYTLPMLQEVVDSLVAAGFESTNFQTVINEVKGITPAPTMAPTNQPTLAPNTVITPTPTVQPSASLPKQFIFRQDDIEDWYHNQVQANLLSFFLDRGIGVSAGIIGDYVTGEDTVIYNVLQRCVSLGSDKCALFNHGSDAKFLFGGTNNVLSQVYQIQKCDQKISSLFSGYKTEVFVPHENSWNAYTLQALQMYGYSAISASSESYSGMTWDLTKNPIQMPQQTTTGLYTDMGTWAANPAKNIIADCNAAAAKGEICVIMIHPHEFANGAYSLSMLQQVVDGLIAAGFTSTNFQTVINEVKAATA